MTVPAHNHSPAPKHPLLCKKFPTGWLCHPECEVTYPPRSAAETARDRQYAAAQGLAHRLATVRQYVDDPGNWSALDGRRRHLLDLIDGVTTPPGVGEQP